MGQTTGASPISAHKVFPAIVALWFAALFGLGSLVVPSVLFDTFVDATGLAEVAPALAPPLSFGAKGMIAATAAVLGAILGFALGRAIGRSHNRGATRKDVRPISAKEELGSDSIDAPVGDETPVSKASDEPLSAPANPKHVPGRRRALAVNDESAPSEFLYTVPVPGQADPEPFDGQAPLPALESSVTDFSAPQPPAAQPAAARTTEKQVFQPIEAETHESVDEDEALELGAFDLEPSSEADSEDASDLARLKNTPAPFVANSSIDPRAQAAPAERQMFQPAEFAEAASETDAPFAAPRRPAIMEAQDFASFEADDDAVEDGEEEAAPLPFAPPSLACKLAPLEDPAAQSDDPVEDDQDNADDAEPQVSAESAADSPRPTFAAPTGDDATPLDRLGLVELVERLGRTLSEAPRPVPAKAEQGDADRNEDAGLAHLANLQKPAAAAMPQAAPATDAEPTEYPDLEVEPADAPAHFAPPEEASVEPTVESRAPSPFHFLDPQSGLDEEDEDGDEDLGLTFPRTAVAQTSISFGSDSPPAAPFAPPANAAAPFAPPMAEDDENGVEEDGAEDEDTGDYSSLLGMKNAFREPEERVRIEEPEDDGEGMVRGEVVFPGQDRPAPVPQADARQTFEPHQAFSLEQASATPRPDSQASQDALRSALANLQRMNKAG